MIFLVSIVFVSVCACVSYQNAYAGNGINIKLNVGKDRFIFSDWEGPDIPVWTYVPKKGNTSNQPIAIIMHGTKRDADRYRDEWAALAEQYDFIVVAPQFSKAAFPKAANYNLGGVFRGKGKDKDKKLQDEGLWAFSAIEPLFTKVVDLLESNQIKYTLYGHSAGAQFVHRFLLYKPKARVRRYIAANAGWYTMPDFDKIYPYGLNGAEIRKSALKKALQKDVIILLGDQDIDKTSSSLRRTPEAMKQGVNRFERGHFFFNQARERARKLGVVFGWKLGIVRGAGHHNRQMAIVAARLVY